MLKLLAGGVHVEAEGVHDEAEGGHVEAEELHVEAVRVLAVTAGIYAAAAAGAAQPERQQTMLQMMPCCQVSEGSDCQSQYVH